MKNLLFITFFLFALWSCEEANQHTTATEEVEENPASQVVPEEAEPFLGWWDLTYDIDGSPAPSWLEIKLSGFATLVGRYVSTTGSARPISHIFLEDGVSIFPFLRSGKVEKETSRSKASWMEIIV